MDREVRGAALRPAGLFAVAGGAAMLLLSLLQPVAARPNAQVTITPTAFVYLPYAARSEIVTTPGPTPMPDVDLIIGAIVISPPQPRAGDPFVISVQVRNQGSDSSDTGTSVNVSAGGFQESFPVPTLTAHGAVTVGWGLNLSSTYTHTAEAEADPGDFIAETNENNNTLSQDFYVLPPS